MRWYLFYEAEFYLQSPIFIKSKIRHLRKVTGLRELLEIVLYMNPVFPARSGNLLQYLEKYDSNSSDLLHNIVHDNI
jgi:hypothetical protein